MKGKAVKKYIENKYDKWLKLQDKIKRRDNYQCRKCNSEIGVSVHHITPRKKGGKSEQRNLITLCEECHNWADAFLPTWEDLLKPYPKETKPKLWWGVSKEGIVFSVPAGCKKEYNEMLEDIF